MQARTAERRIDTRRASDGLQPSCQSWITAGVTEGVKEGVESGLKAVFNDTEFCEKFWTHGHKVFMERTTVGVNIWFGKRFLQWVTVVLVAVGGAVWSVLKLK